MEIVIINQQTKVKLSNLKIHRLTQAILDLEGVDQDSNLSIVFVSHQKMRATHQQFLKINRSTDVLAFDLKENSQKNKKTLIIGEIIVCVDEAKTNASYYHNSFDQELALYLIHGILHLRGFDDHAPQDIQRMRKREQYISEAVASFIKGIILSK